MVLWRPSQHGEEVNFWRGLEAFLIGLLLGLIFCFAQQAFSAAPYDSVLQVTHGEMTASCVYIGNHHCLTAAHVSGDIALVKKKPVEVPFKVDGHVAEMVWSDPATELGLFSTIADPPPADLSCGKPDLVIGDDVEAVGFPYGEDKFASFGKVGAPVDQRTVEAVPQVDFIINAMIVPGMSGGAVLDKDGKVAGIISADVAIRGVPLPMGFIIPRSIICKELQSASQKG